MAGPCPRNRRSSPLAGPIQRKPRIGCFSIFVLLTIYACFTQSVNAAAPKVAKASPDNGDTDVDPALREITIEFDQDMKTDGFSVCGGGPSFPEVVGQPKWRGNRVFVLSVKLVPDHDYQFSINCPSATNFRNRNGEIAEIYPISFHTASATGKKAKKLTPKKNATAIARLRSAIDEAYSYKDLRKVDWNTRFDKYSTKLKKSKTSAEFARQAAKLLAAAKDVHIWLQVGTTTFSTYQRRYTPNYNLKLLSRIVPQWKEHNAVVVTGKFDDGVAYILIKTWGINSAQDLEPAYAAIASAASDKGLIIDVRPNGGGSEPLAREFASCFATQRAVYSKSVYRTKRKKSGFAKPAERTIEPSKEHSGFKGPVVVLMGKGVMSSCESFVLMMRHGAKATLLGETTYGSSGNPKPHELGNGVTVMLPAWKDMQVNGKLIEGKGIEPDIHVAIKKGDFKDSDPVLDAARKELEKRATKK